jgi:hypothetical protein
MHSSKYIMLKIETKHGGRVAKNIRNNRPGIGCKVELLNKYALKTFGPGDEVLVDGKRHLVYRVDERFLYLAICETSGYTRYQPTSSD